MPTATIKMGEEGMWCFSWLCVLSIKGLRKDADLATREVRSKRLGRGVKAVLGRKKHGTGGEHDRWVIENPVVIKGDQVVNSLSHEWMLFFGEHEIVRNADGDGARQDDGENEERV